MVQTDLQQLVGNGGEVGVIKDAMQTSFRSFLPDSVEVYRGVYASMELPCVCIGEVQITPSRTFGNVDGPGMEVMNFTVSVFTSAAEDQDAQRVLDWLVSRNGLIRQALWDMRGEPGVLALGGVADDVYLFDISGYGMISIGDNGSLYGANLSVRVIVS